MNDVPKIEKSDKVITDKTYVNPDRKRKKQQKRHRDEVKTHFQALTEMVHEVHQELEAKKSPYRFCIYQENNDVFIDVVTINKSGNIDNVFKHKITNDQFLTWVKNIKSGLGLVFDREV